MKCYTTSEGSVQFRKWPGPILLYLSESYFPTLSFFLIFLSGCTALVPTIEPVDAKSRISCRSDDIVLLDARLSLSGQALSAFPLNGTYKCWQVTPDTLGPAVCTVTYDETSGGN